MFSMTAFCFWRGGCFKAPMSEGMDGIRRAKGWMRHGGGLIIGRGGFSS